MMTVEEKKAVDEAKAAIKSHRTRIARLKVLERGRDQDFWAALRDEIKLSIDSTEKIRDNAIADDQIKDVAAQYALIKACGRSILAYKGILQNVDQAEAKGDYLNEKIGEINRYIEGIEKGKGADKRQEVV